MGDGNFEIWEIVEENAKALADRIPAIGQTSTDYERLIGSLHELAERGDGEADRLLERLYAAEYDDDNYKKSALAIAAHAGKITSSVHEMPDFRPISKPHRL